MEQGTVYSSLKVFKFQNQLSAFSKKGLAAPVHIRIKPVNACNHNCWYCAYRFDNVQLGNDMNVRDRIPEAKMKEIVEDIIEMNVKAVTFSGGGEPLSYPYLASTARRLAEGGVKIATLTNGAFLRGEVADVFSQMGSWVRVSVDAWDGPSYSKSRGVKEDAFDKLLINLKNFSDKKGPCALGLSFIIGKENAPHIFDAMKQFKEAGVGHVKLYGVVIGNSVPENNQYHQELWDTVHEQIEKSKRLLEEPVAEGGGRSPFKIVDQYHYWEENFDKSYHSCGSLQFLTIIGADSKVYTCQDKAYTESGCLGSIQDRSFKEFWFSDENRKRIDSIDPSRDCKHHCVSHRKNLLISEFASLNDEHAYFV